MLVSGFIAKIGGVGNAAATLAVLPAATGPAK